MSNEVLKYKDCGVTNLIDHVKWRGHVSKLLNAQNNIMLPGVSNPVETNMYEATPLFHNISKLMPPTTFQPSLHMQDQKANMKTILIALLAVKSLPMTTTGKSMFVLYFILVFLNTVLVDR